MAIHHSRNLALQNLSCISTLEQSPFNFFPFAIHPQLANCPVRCPPRRIQHSPHAKPTRQRHLRDQHERDPRSGECQESSAALLQRTVELHTRVRHIWAGLLPLCQPKCIFCRRCFAGANQLQHRGCCVGYSQKLGGG